MNKLLIGATLLLVFACGATTGDVSVSESPSPPSVWTDLGSPYQTTSNGDHVYRGCDGKVAIYLYEGHLAVIDSRELGACEK